MTTGELIQRIQSLYSKGVQSDDSRLTPRHIYSKLLTARQNLIYQKNQSGAKINPWNYQTLTCVELINVPTHECSCLPELDCGILRTKYKLPKPITLLGSLQIHLVATVDGSIVYEHTSRKKQRWNKGNKYKSKKPQWYLQNEYLYVNDKDASNVILIEGIFEDPWEAKKFPNACGGSSDTTFCESPFDQEFPIDSDLIEPMVQMAVQELIQLFSQNTEDQTNNSQDNRVESSK